MSKASSPKAGGGSLKRRILCGAAVLLLAWLAFAPSRVGPAIVRRAILAQLNAPEKGLSCRDAEVEFGYWDLVRHLRVSRLELRGLSVDLSKSLTGAVTNLVDRRDVTLDVCVTARLPQEGLRISASGRLLDTPFAVSGGLAANWSTNLVDATGRVRLDVGEGEGPGAPWCGADIDFAASPSEWSVDAIVPEFAVSESDSVIGRLVSRLAIGSVSNLTFAASLAAEAHACRTRQVPVVAWRAKGVVRDGRAAAETSGTPLKADGLSASLAAEGLANRTFLKPVRLRAREITGSGLRLDGFYASVSKDDDLFFVTEAGAGFCGGTVRLYSLYLDTARLNAGFTLFLDDIDAGCVLAAMPCFRGEATGRLHGKLPLALHKGERLRFRDAFLYSTPGETGKLRLDDTAPIVGNLAAGGVPAETCANFSKALKNLDYDVLRFRFVRGEGDDASLSVKVGGSASDGKVTVPVDFEVTFHGALEQLVNFGLRVGR